MNFSDGKNFADGLIDIVRAHVAEELKKHATETERRAVARIEALEKRIAELEAERAHGSKSAPVVRLA
jgi:hypothetical protein